MSGYLLKKVSRERLERWAGQRDLSAMGRKLADIIARNAVRVT
jgi:hypothetical protein